MLELTARCGRWCALGRRRLAVIIALATVALVAEQTVVLSPPASEAAGTTLRSRPAPSWSVDGVVRVTSIVGDTVLVGGRFSAAISPDGTRVPVRNLAAFDLDDGRLRSWRADTDGVVRALVVRDGAVWVGGYFSRVDGVERRGLAKVDLASGDVDRGFDADLSLGVQALALHRGSLFLGGVFGEVGGVARKRLAKVDAATGAVVRRFKARVGGPVSALLVDPARPRLWVGGNFTTAGGKRRVGVAAVARGSGAVRGPRLRGVRRPALALDASPNGAKVFVGSGGGNRISAVRVADGSLLWQRRARGDVQAVRLAEGRVYYGFHEGVRGDDTAKVLRADARTGRVQRWRPRIPAFWGVYSVDVSRRWVVIGGAMDTVSGVPAQGWARFQK